jgi:hypothetical protein
MGDLELFAYYYIFEDEDEDDKKQPGLSLEDRRRRSKRFPRISLQQHKKSAFRFMFNSGNNQALINCCGVDHQVFSDLLVWFEPVFNSYTINRKTGRPRKLEPSAMGMANGRPRNIDATGLLGLVLFWYRTRGSVARAISMSFGLVASNLYDWLTFGRRALLFSLQKCPEARVTVPTASDVDRYVEAVANKYPELGTCFHSSGPMGKILSISRSMLMVSSFVQLLTPTRRPPLAAAWFAAAAWFSMVAFAFFMEQKITDGIGSKSADWMDSRYASVRLNQLRRSGSG